MPTLHVHVTGRPGAGQKRALARTLTEAVCEAVDKTPADVTIYFYSHGGGAQDMAHAGVLASDRARFRGSRRRVAARPHRVRERRSPRTGRPR